MEKAREALACGERKMIKVPIVGRAVRIFGNWYCLCSLCGSVVKVAPSARFGGEISCLRCDVSMLGLPPVEAGVSNDQAAECRFCNKRTLCVAKTCWKIVKAPLDLSGRNAALPPPLRTVAYCATHFKPWVAAAHRTLSTRVILSHISLGARPVFGAELTGRLTLDEIELGLGVDVKKKRKLKRAKPKSGSKRGRKKKEPEAA